MLTFTSLFIYKSVILAVRQEGSLRAKDLHQNNTRNRDRLVNKGKTFDSPIDIVTALYNKLSDELKQIHNLEKLKRQLKTWLIESFIV